MIFLSVVKALAGGLGAFLVGYTVVAAIRSFVMPRNDSVRINNWVFTGLRYLFTTLARLGRTYEHRDRTMALYAPVGLVALPIAWLGAVSLGYTAMFWALGEGDWERCYRISNSSLLTLGSEKPSRHMLPNIASYSEATLGLLLLTLLISYLPTMYQAFSRREQVVARLELRAGTEATAVELLCWLSKTNALHDGQEQWGSWEEWFVEIEETHTSLPVLAFFRSPKPGRSWVMAADIVLDAAALLSSLVEVPRNPHQELCFKAGCLAVNRVSRFFRYEAQSETPAPLSSHDALKEPTRADFRTAYAQLRAANIPVRPDEEAAWRQYQQLRSRYAEAIGYLAKLVMAPEIKTIRPGQ
jgi:hypothetical protein